MSLKDDLLKCADIKDRVKRQVSIAGIITRALEPLGITPIVVGGSAVEFYTFGQYATMDIDTGPGGGTLEGPEFGRMGKKFNGNLL